MNKKNFGVYIMVTTSEEGPGYVLEWSGFTEKEADLMCQFLTRTERGYSDLRIVEIAKQQFIKGKK